MSKTTCPNTPDGKHRYFIFKTFETHELIDPAYYTVATIITIPIYQKMEYALLGCNCGTVIKRVIKDGDAL